MHPTSRSTLPRPRAASRFRLARAVVLTATLFVLAACGQPANIVVSLETASAELLRGAEVVVEVTLTRTGGASADVELAVAGLPANVSALFSPPVLSGDTLTSTLTLSAATAASEEHHALSVTATGPGLTANAPLSLEIVSLTVTGRLSGIFGTSFAGVALASQEDTAVTDANGNFTLTGLSVPYDVSAWSAADQWLHVYQGLTSADVTLSTNFAPPTTVGRSTTISGPLTGGVMPVAANQVVKVCAEGLDGIAMGCSLVGPGGSTFSFSVQWLGPTTRTVRLHLLQIESDADGVPVAYNGYASLELDLSDATPVLLTTPIDLGPALETNLVDLQVESPATLAVTIAAVQVGPNLTISLMTNNDATTTFEVPMPVIPDAGYTFISGMGINQYGWVSGNTGESATVVVPELPTLTAPADLATGVTVATEFSASSPTGGPMTWLWTDAGATYTVGLTSMSDTVNIPDTSEYGFALPAGANFNWQVLASPAGSLESGARAPGHAADLFILAFLGASAGFDTDGFVATSESWTFTTAP